MIINKHRDVEFIRLDDEKYLVIACDSCGSIGLKEHDTVKVPYFITGKYTTRVCLMEILSIGGKLIGLTANICNEPHPTGDEILKGIKDELKESDSDISITISTEKNMKTSMTALGITAIGIVSEKELMLNKVTSGNYVYTIGTPSIGNEVLENKIADIRTLQTLLDKDFVKEIIPVGSSGIMGELNKLLQSYNLNIEYADNIQVDMKKSAGPSTVLIVITNKKITPQFNLEFDFVGKLT